LLGQDVASADGAFLQDSDGRHIGQSLGDAQLVRSQRAGLDAEQVERADGLGTQPHGHGVHRPVAGVQGVSDEAWPLGHAAQVGCCDRPVGTEAVQAGSLVVLQLEQFHHPGPLGGGRGHLKVAALVGQKQSGRVHPQQLDALDGQLMEHVDDVVVGDEGVCQGDECLGQRPLAGALIGAHGFSSSNRNRRPTTS